MIRGSPFRSLNHVSGNAINPPWPMALPLMPSIYFRFRRHSDHYSMLARNAPVANDPNVWSGRASQEIFVELVMNGLASMYPVFNWSVLRSGPSWVSARVRSH
jgi:hypothetical protein